MDNISPPYVERVAKIMDVQIVDDVEQGGSGFSQNMFVMLQDVNDGLLFTLTMNEKDLAHITGITQGLTARELLSFATKLKMREDPVKLLVPPDVKEITKLDVLRGPKNKRNRNRKHKRQWTQQQANTPPAQK